MVGFANSGKTSVLTNLSKKLNLKDVCKKYPEKVYNGKYKNKYFSVITTGDSKDVIKWSFDEIKNEKNDLIVCCSHTKGTITEIYNQLINNGIAKNMLEAKTISFLVFKNRNEENENLDLLDDIFVKKMLKLIESIMEDSNE